MSLAIYQLTSGFPKEELFGLTGQIRRAGVSVASNIAEGYGRSSTGEYKQFLGVAPRLEFGSRNAISNSKGARLRKSANLERN